MLCAERHRGFESHPLRQFLVGRDVRKGAGAVELARLESVCTARYRGFESHPFRHFSLRGYPKTGGELRRQGQEALAVERVRERPRVCSR